MRHLYLSHHATYSAIKFEVTTSYGLGGDTFTRNVTDGRTDRQTNGRTTDRLWYEINIPFFLKKKAGIVTYPHISGSAQIIELKVYSRGKCTYCETMKPVYLIQSKLINMVSRRCNIVGSL